MNTHNVYESRIKEAARLFATNIEETIGTSPFSREAIEEMFANVVTSVLQHLWISVEEEKPTPYRNVFAMFENKHIINAFYDGEAWWWNDGFPVGVNTYGDAIYSSQCKCADTPIKWMCIPKEGGEK